MTRETRKMSPPWLAEAETLRTRVLDRLGEMSPEERRLAPRPGDWSAAQVTTHLILVEELLVDDWRVAAEASPAARPNLKSALTVGMAGFAMKNLPVRVPTIPALDPNAREPDGGGDLPALSARWASVRQRLSGTFPPDATGLWIIHPMFGPLSCPQFGTFLVSHLHHHLNRWPGKSDPTPPRK